MSPLARWTRRPAAALRIARREALRAKGRSALVLAMIGLPVACMAFLVASYDMFTLTAQEQAERRLGKADALLMWETGNPIRQMPDEFPSMGDGTGSRADKPPGGEADLKALLPQGTRLVRVDTFEVRVRTRDGIGSLTGRLGEPGDPMFAGLVRILDGKAPGRPGEVALNPEAAERLGAGIGDTVRDRRHRGGPAGRHGRRRSADPITSAH